MYIRLARPFPSPDTSHGFAFHLGGFEAHDESGGAFLEALGFDGAVGFLTAQHVAAKRYLVAVDPRYAAKLSRASRTTLGFQGGPMSAAEVARCEADPRWGAALRLRAFDEAAKEPADFRGWGAARVVGEFEEELRAAMARATPTTTTTATATATATTGDEDDNNQQHDYKYGAGFGAGPSPFAVSYVLSPEQLRKWGRDGLLLVRGAVPEKHEENSAAWQEGCCPHELRPWQ